MDDLRLVRSAFRQARRVTVLAGAGVSAASGIPTFRGPGGLWRTFRAETLATPAAFQRDPRMVWEWYDWRRQLIRDAQPNAAHAAIARWTRERPGVTLVTQNVDGLDERAGADRIIRLHGSIWHLSCSNVCTPGRAPWLDESVPLARLPPPCPHCGAPARPAVVWFGERLDADVVAAAAHAAACDLFLTVGTSALVHPAAGLIDEARRHGALTVEINPETTGASGIVDIALPRRAEEVLPQL